MVKVNLGFHKFFGIKYMFISGVYSSYLYGCLLLYGRQWKHFNLSHDDDFSNDPRNIRFGLSTDGMNPFREMRNPHST
jgi:hypothetical protein